MAVMAIFLGGRMEGYQVSRSTKYNRKAFLFSLNAIQVWAACKKARSAGSDLPTYEAVFGSSDRVIRTWRNSRTKELRVAVEAPRGSHWTKVTEYDLLVANGGSKLTSDIEITFLAVDDLFKEFLSLDDRRKLLRLFPLTGCYSGTPINEEEVKAHFDLLNSGQALPSDSSFESETEFQGWLDKVRGNRAVRAALNVLRDNAMIARPQSKGITIGRNGQLEVAV